MNSVFSVDDFSDSFWAASALEPASGLNRSQSEWALQRLLEEVSASTTGIPTSRAAENVLVGQPSASKAQEAEDDADVVEIKRPNNHDRNQDHHHPFPPPSDPAPSVPVDSDEYRAFLKSKLDLACAAVALSRASVVKAEDSSPQPESQAHQSAPEAGGFSKPQTEPDAAPSGVPLSAATQGKSGVQLRQTTSGSSREDSDDDELEGDIETAENMDPADAKRARRMLSNRESARRSRRRKQAHMNELETQVGQLRVERSTLLKRLTDLNQKYDDSAVDNRILKADIETLRARVKLAEETVKRVTGINPQVLPRPILPTPGLPFVSSPLEAPTSAAVPMQPNTNHFFHQSVPGISTAIHHQRLENSFPNNNLIPPIVNPQTDVGVKNVTVSPLQQTPRMEPLQDQIGCSGIQNQNGHGVSPCGTIPGWDSGLSHAVAKNKKQS